MSPVPFKSNVGAIFPEAPAELAALTPTALRLDSRECQPGDLFLALPGSERDGRDYIAQALVRGVDAVIAESVGFLEPRDERVVLVTDLAARLPDAARDFYGDPSRNMAIAAVTGTNGKTSTVEFIAQLLRGLGVATGSIGTLGVRTTAAPVGAINTTPDVVTLNRQLAEWRDEGIDHVAMEASSHALDQGRMQGLNLHTGVFTNLSRDHLDYHGNEQNYAEAKFRLFEEFSLKRALYNADDAIAPQVRGRCDCPVMGISLQATDCDVFVQVLAQHPLTLRLHTPLGTDTLTVKLSGAFNAFNLVAAIMTVVGMGYPYRDVVAQASELEPVQGRMQQVPNERDLRVVVDYAHTPDALSGALAALRPGTGGKLWVVFGCGGDRDSGKRAMMGEVAERLADRVVITSDNPRTESAGGIIDDVLAGTRGQVEVLPDRAAAISGAISQAAPGDTILIAGKGHEDYQEIDGRRMPFSDYQQAASALAVGGLHG